MIPTRRPVVAAGRNHRGRRGDRRSPRPDDPHRRDVRRRSVPAATAGGSPSSAWTGGRGERTRNSARRGLRVRCAPPKPSCGGRRRPGRGRPEPRDHARRHRPLRCSGGPLRREARGASHGGASLRGDCRGRHKQNASLLLRRRHQGLGEDRAEAQASRTLGHGGIGGAPRAPSDARPPAEGIGLAEGDRLDHLTDSQDPNPRNVRHEEVRTAYALAATSPSRPERGGPRLVASENADLRTTHVNALSSRGTSLRGRGG